MATGRPKGSGSPFFCETCKITTLVKRIHLRSVAHRQNRRIRALLSKPCIRFTEVGRRVGVSKERVRQIADKFCQATGRQRQLACAIITPYKLPSNCLALKAEKVCREKGLQFQFTGIPIGNRRKLFASLAIIENEKCVLRRSSERRNGNIVVRKPGITAKDANFMLSPISEGRWLIIPRSKWPRASTEFKPGELQKPGGKSKRHDWPAYIDAWHLLKPS